MKKCNKKQVFAIFFLQKRKKDSKRNSTGKQRFTYIFSTLYILH